MRQLNWESLVQEEEPLAKKTFYRIAGKVQNMKNCRCKRCFTVVNVTNGANINMRLFSVKFFSHSLYLVTTRIQRARTKSAGF